MKINRTLIERGKMGRDRSIINLDNLIFDEEVPVYLGNDNVDKEPIGIAKVTKDQELNFLFADIDLPSNKSFLKLYPSLAISVEKPDITSTYRGNIRVINQALLIGIVLSEHANHDPKITTLGRNRNGFN